jgi:hypothetical protein
VNDCVIDHHDVHVHGHAQYDQHHADATSSAEWRAGGGSDSHHVHDHSGGIINGDHYDNSASCTFVYQSAGATTIARREWDLESDRYAAGCPYDYLQVDSGTKYCGAASDNEAFPASQQVGTGETTYSFNSDYSINGAGFRLCVDNCAGVTSCQNGGTCLDGADSFSCTCANDFSGEFCNVARPVASEVEISATCTSELTLVGITPAEFTDDVRQSVRQACAAAYNVHISQVIVTIHMDRRMLEGTAAGAVTVDVTITAPQTIIDGDGTTANPGVQQQMANIATNTAAQATFTQTVNTYVAAVAPAITVACTVDDVVVDVNECAAGPCQNGAACTTPNPNDYECACVSGWEGKDCDIDTDECAASPCQNSAVCTTPSFNDYSCACVSGWEGKDCDVDINECDAAPCQNGGACTTPNHNSYSCACANGFDNGGENKNCDECWEGKGFFADANGGQGQCDACLDPKFNNGPTHDAPCATQTCIEGYGVTSDGHPGVTTGWIATGGNCEICAPGYQSLNDSGQCADVDECEAGSVLDVASGLQVTRAKVDCGRAVDLDCANNLNKFTCTCAPGWVGGGDNTVCTMCPEGTYELNGVCTDCATGTYNDELGQTMCTDCVAGTYNEATKSTDASACLDCPVRTYSGSPQSKLASNCLACAHCKKTDVGDAGTGGVHCNLDRDVNCVVDSFTAWGACDATCHEGHAHRTRLVTVPHCHNGALCPHLAEKKHCMDRICDCNRVLCKYEAHTCTNYVDAAGLQYHNVDSWMHAGAAGRIADDAHSAYIPAGNAGWGVGNLHGAKTADDNHDSAAVCDDTTVRVYHDKTERAGEGHHCKSANSVCTCRCHALFKGNYNPKSGLVNGVEMTSASKFDYSAPVLQDGGAQTMYSATAYNAQHPGWSLTDTSEGRAENAWYSCSAADDALHLCTAA